MYEGSIHLIIGTPNVGKTTELHRLRQNIKTGNKKSVIVLYEDGRENDTLEETFKTIKLSPGQYILIDDIHQYNDAVQFCAEKAINGYHLIVTGNQCLNTSALIPIAHKITDLFLYPDANKHTFHLIIGPMFAGKTSELMRLKRRDDIARQKSIIIRYYKDVRYGNGPDIFNHDHSSMPCVISCNTHLAKTLETIDLTDIVSIYIDEIQFYTDAVEVCQTLFDNGHNVIVSGLQGDYTRSAFSNINVLAQKCNKITHLTAVDQNSGAEAAFTKRLTTESSIELIGGTESYHATDLYNYFQDKIN